MRGVGNFIEYHKTNFIEYHKKNSTKEPAFSKLQITNQLCNQTTLSIFQQYLPF